MNGPILDSRSRPLDPLERAVLDFLESEPARSMLGDVDANVPCALSDSSAETSRAIRRLAALGLVRYHPRRGWCPTQSR